MTSLAAQLKKLAVPETQSLLSGDTRQASFLYDEREAAAFEKQHFYNIGINGLQQLIERDERFTEFEQNLFSPSSQSLQRFVQTSDSNKQLDETISQFLLRLSPYMQLREAHKAMEWMVYRYNVHLRNVDELMMCVLPYHEEAPFMMALKLLKMKSKECVKWNWLEPVQKGESFLPRQSLITHCRNVRGFLGFLCDMLSKHIEANTRNDGTLSSIHVQRVITFYTQIVLGVLLAGPPSEALLSTLMPAIMAGLKSHDLPDHMTSSYMILSQLLTQTSLATSLLDSLLNVIAKNIQPRLLEVAIKVIVIMFQKQDISKVSKKAFKYLVGHGSLMQVLTVLNRQTKIEPFLTPFISVLTQRALKQSTGDLQTSDSNPEDELDSTPPPLISLLRQFLTSFPLEKQTVVVISRHLLNWFTQNTSELETAARCPQTEGAFSVFRLIENRYAEILDQVVEDVTSADQKGAMSEVLQGLLQLSVSAAAHDLTSDPQASLSVCLQHRHASVRKQAVETLLKDSTLIKGEESLQSLLVLRLHDEDPTVLAAALKNPEVLWQMFDDKQLLYETLLKKLSISSKPLGRNERQEDILCALCCVPEEIVPKMEITVIVLSFLLPVKDSDLPLVKKLLTSSVISWNNLLSQVKKDWSPLVLTDGSRRGKKEMADACVKLVDSITSYLASPSQTATAVLATLWESLSATPRPERAALLLLLANLSLIKKVKGEETKRSLQRQLVSALSHLLTTKVLAYSSKHDFDVGKSEKLLSEDVLQKILGQIDAGHSLPLRLVGQVMSRLQLSSTPQKLKDVNFWDLSTPFCLENSWLRTITLGINLLLEVAARKDGRVSNIGREAFQDCFQALESRRCVFKFFCMIWMSSDREEVTCADQARILQFAQVYMESVSQSDRSKLMDEPTPIVPCLLILLSSQYERVREAAVSLLVSLMKGCSPESSYLVFFLDQLLHQRQEVIKDRQFLAQVLKNILEGDESSLSPPVSKKRRKSSSKPPPHSLTLTYLLEIVCYSETPNVVKTGLLSVLSRLDTAESFLPLTQLLQRLVTATSGNNQGQTSSTTTSSHRLSLEEREMVSLLIKKFTKTVAGCIDGSSSCLQTLLACLSSTLILKESGETVQMATVQQLRSKFMSALPSPSRQAVFTRILDLIASTSHIDLARQCRKVIKHMSLDAGLVVDEFKSVLTKASAGTIREAKRQKQQHSSETVESEFETLPWKRIVILLEMIQNKKRLVDAVHLVPACFQVLGRVLELESEGSGEYIKQLLLATVSSVCSRHQQAAPQGMDSVVVKGEHLNMELIVQCIRSSDNPHTHHQALLLLSSAAKIAPGLLLHNMMAVFTFMGANILRQDDAYSFHVIGNILENVIPALVMACDEKSKSESSMKKKVGSKWSGGGEEKPVKTEDMMSVVLRVFVDALPHIPAHRKILLFEKLLSVVGVEKYLWRLILLFIETVTTRSARSTKETAADSSDDEKNVGPLSVSDLEFLTSLLEHVSSCQLFQSFKKMLLYLLNLPEEKKGGLVEMRGTESVSLEEMSAEEMDVFSVPHHTAKQLRHFKFATLFALHHILSSQALLAQLAQVESSSFLPDYQSLMETLLQLIGQLTKSHDRYREDASARFWRILLHKSHDLLDQMVHLLPDSMFLQVVSGLMKHNLSLVQRRAIEILNTKLQQYKENFDIRQMDMLLSLSNQLESIVANCLLKKTSQKDEDIVNGQTALYSLKVLCRLLGEKYYRHFLQVLDLCVRVMSRHHDNGMLSASAMLCAAEVVSSAKIHAIEQLKEFVPLIISTLGLEVISHQEVLLLAGISSLQKIVESVPLFLSPYLLDIIVQICSISSRLESNKPGVAQKIRQICATLASVTPTRTFLPVLQKSLTALESKIGSCSECVMGLLKEHIAKMSKEDLTTFSQDLLKFFITCFDIRSTHPEMSESDLDMVESQLIEAFISLVFKLSEAQFKPILLQIYNWATEEDVSRDRILVFYRLCNSLAEKLKNLFLLFAGHIIKHSAQVLESNNKHKTKCHYFGKGKLARAKSCHLLVYVLDCLHKTFIYDTEGFLNKERFDILMQPLVDQLDNCLGKSSVVESRVLNHLVPCLASLASAAHDDSLWKDLNYQILLKTRQQDPKVKIWALSAVDALHKQLGEDYTQLVPETIPFMAELMEDESDEVEKETQKVLAAMEVSVGENLQEYF